VVQPDAEDVEAKSDAGSEAAKSEKPAEVEGGEADGDVDVSPEAMAAYNKKIEQQKREDADTDEEYQPLEIRTKVHAYKASHNNTLSSEVMSEAFRWRLSQTDCQNRGYVLDGYPKSYLTAGEVFIVTPERPPKPAPKKDEEGNVIDEEPLDAEAQEAEDKKYAPTFQKHIYPNSVIYLRGDDNAIIKREQKKGSSEEAIDSLRSRLDKYKTDNDLNLFKVANTNDKLGHSNCPALKYPIMRFFQENKTEVFEIDHNGEKFEMFEGMRVYIERNGRPFNYLKSVRHLNKTREENLKEEETNDNQTKAT